MSFVHQDKEFDDLIRTTASEGPITSEAMVEKDYWICHTLWALENSGLEFYFKGGTSLSKAFGLLPRLLGGPPGAARHPRRHARTRP
jgi:hypothetical protein